ncbi:RHS repeat-associated core domain-containing protein, partial [Candidatus Gottesmanbacteria bacterium]|nr:RHS repeat-associated core domain-containing protein [Candidatus Gottesmanbacteria bacterium]
EGGSIYQILGLPKETVDQNHQIASYIFDNFGRLLNTTSPNDQGGDPTSVREYSKDSNGRYIVKTKTRKDAGGATSGTYISSWIISNGLGETIQTQAEGDNRLIVADTSYNAQGKVEKQTLPWEGNLTQVGSYQNPNWSKVTATTYDFLGRPRIVTSPDSTTTETVYDDYQRSVTTFDALRHKAVSYADVRGNTIRVEGYTGTGDYQLYSTTTSVYDTQGRLTNIFDNNNNETKIVYDSLGRVREKTDPDLGKWLYPEYDKNGNLLLQQDARGKRIRFEYDALNRLTKKTWLDEGNKVFTYDYGHKGAEISNNRIGKLWKKSDPTGNFWEATGFDTNGRLTNEKYHLYNQDYSFSYSYDAQNRMTNLTYPDGEQIIYEYNNQGLKKAYSKTTNDILVDKINYLATGQIQSRFLGESGRTLANYAYDQRNLRLKQLVVKVSRGGADYHPVLNYGYDYSDIGNITGIKDQGVYTAFTYDDFSRLTDTSGAYFAHYAYDNLGNLTTKNEQENLTIIYDNTHPVHAPKSVDHHEYKYDNNGNLIQDELREKIDYDSENRPILMALYPPLSPPQATVIPLQTTTPPTPTLQTTTPTPTCIPRPPCLDLPTPCKVMPPENGWFCPKSTPTPQPTSQLTVNFSYDGDGNRIRKEVVGGDTTIYIGNYLEKNLTKNETTKYYFAGSQRLAFRKSSSPASLYFIHTDHLSSTTLITDKLGNQISRYDYYPYGSFRTTSQPTKQLTSYLFTGQARDQEIGLDYFKARYYSPRLGRFISADTVQGANRYAYANNNPTMFNDPTGNDDEKPEEQENKCEDVLRCKHEQKYYDPFNEILFNRDIYYIYKLMFDLGFTKDELVSLKSGRVDEVKAKYVDMVKNAKQIKGLIVVGNRFADEAMTRLGARDTYSSDIRTIFLRTLSLETATEFDYWSAINGLFHELLHHYRNVDPLPYKGTEQDKEAKALVLMSFITDARSTKVLYSKETIRKTYGFGVGFFFNYLFSLRAEYELQRIISPNEY